MTTKDRPFRPLATFTGTDSAQRKILEQVFFHDILNLAGGVKGLMEVMNDADEAQKLILSQSVQVMADQLVDEIIAHRDFLCAESGDLALAPQPLRSDDLLHNLQEMFRSHPHTGSHTLWIHPGYESFLFHTDQRVINRVLINMVKNALEATREQEVVTLNCGRGETEIWFSVQNPGVVAPEIRASIFEPAFSTKGAGRGLGTYSMKLLSETYLGGRIGFTSDPTAGTTFKVTLPPGAP